jgi:cytosine/adenosine deaminase-related metal-dependent hydrolase
VTPSGLTVAVRAAWVVPVAGPPIAGGVVLCRDGRVEAVSEAAAVQPRIEALERTGQSVRRIDVGSTVLMPALVNAHTHLELSWMRGRLPATGSLPEWVAALVHLRRTEPADEAASSEAGIAESLAAGTGVVGDVSNSLASCGPLSRSGLRAVVFHELIGFRPESAAALVQRAQQQAQAVSAGGLRVTLAAHAPYSVSPELFAEIRRALAGQARPLTSVHLAESLEECRFLRDGSGPWRQLLEQVGSWVPAWAPPACGPAEYLERLGWLGPGTSIVHGVQLTRGELDRLAESGTSVIACPRSNLALGVGAPPVEDFLASGVTLAVGTDSLASVGDLNVFAELQALRRLAPEAPARRLLRCATLDGARALGVEQDFGSLEPGKCAALLGVDVGEAEDVEEALLGGVRPAAVRWVGH